tara:strand:+ start:613 stop:1290 length:678 start_codon:yes stop_codon:yes gene_type:complete
MPKEFENRLTKDDIALAMSTGRDKYGNEVNPFNFTEENIAKLLPYVPSPRNVARCNSKEGVYELLAKTEEEMRRNEREQAEKLIQSRDRVKVKEVVCTPTTALKKSRAATKKANKSLALARKQLRQVKANQARSAAKAQKYKEEKYKYKKYKELYREQFNTSASLQQSASQVAQVADQATALIRQHSDCESEDDDAGSNASKAKQRSVSDETSSSSDNCSSDDEF